MVRSTLPSKPTLHSALALALLAGAALPVLSGCANARASSHTPPAAPPPATATIEPAAPVAVEANAGGGAFDNSLLKLQQRAQAAEAERLRKEWEPVEPPAPRPARRPKPPTEPRTVPPGSRYSPEEFARLQERQFKDQLSNQQVQDEERRTAESEQVRAASEENAKQEKDRVYFPWKGGWAYTTSDARRSVIIHKDKNRTGNTPRPDSPDKNPGE